MGLWKGIEKKGISGFQETNSQTITAIWMHTRSYMYIHTYVYQSTLWNSRNFMANTDNAGI